jgi:hypothetical protein
MQFYFFLNLSNKINICLFLKKFHQLQFLHFNHQLLQYVFGIAK